MRRSRIFIAGSPDYSSPRAGDPGTHEGYAPLGHRRCQSDNALDDRLLFGLLPLGDRVRVAGSAEITGFDPKPVVARCDAIVANAGKTVPSLKAAFRKDQPTYCTGLRPVTPGGTPLIGRTRIKGLWINCGHGHLGWTMACGSGRVLADLMEGRDPGIPLLEPQGYIVR